MKPLPARLIGFWVLVVALCTLALIRGLSTEGERRIVWAALGTLGLVSALIFLMGWVRQSRRQ